MEGLLKQSQSLQQKLKDLLLVAEDKNQCAMLTELIGTSDVRIKTISNGKDIPLALKKKRFDCIVLDLSWLQVPSMQVVDLLLEP